MTAMDPNVFADAFRGFEDDVAGAITAQTAKAAVDTNWNQNVDEKFHVALLVTESAGNATGGKNYRFEYNLNSTGWNDVTTSTPIQAVAPTNCTTTDAASYGTTALTTGLTIQATEYDTGGADSGSINLNNASFEYTGCFQIDSAQVANGDTIQLRLTQAGTPVQADTTIPSITVVETSNTNVPLNNGSFTLSGQTLDAIEIVDLDNGTFTLSGFAFQVDHSIPFDLGTFNLSGNNLDVDFPVPLSLGSFTLTGFTGAASLYLEPTNGSFALSGFDVDVQLGAQNIPLDLGTFALTGQALGIDHGVPLVAGTFSVSGLDFSTDLGIALGLGSYNLSGNALGVDLGVPLALGAFTLTGQELGVTETLPVPFDVGAYTVSGLALTIGHGVPLALGSFTLTGQELGVSETLPVPLNLGSFTLTGQELGLNFDTGVLFDLGTFTWSGFALGISEGTIVPLDNGSFTLAGQPLVVDQNSPLGLGSFSLTGQTLDVSLGSTVVTLNPGGYTVSGLALGVDAGEQVPLAVGAYTLAGFDGASFIYLEPSPGSFTVTGQPLTIQSGGGATGVPLDSGLFNLSGLSLAVGAGAGNLTGTLDQIPEPDTLDYVLENTFTGTLYWVITASATPPELVASPPGFSTSGVLSGSVAVTGSAGTASIDTSSVHPGNYYIHAVAYRPSDGSFSAIESLPILIAVEMDLGTFSLVGFNVVLGEQVDLSTGTFDLQGYELGIGNVGVPLQKGSFALSGNNVNVDTGITLALGSFAWAGSDLNVSSLVKLNRGQFNLTGQDLTIAVPALNVPLDLGAFAWAGNPITLGTAEDVPLDLGAFNVAGLDLALLTIPIVRMNTGAFSLNVFDLDVLITIPDPPNFATPGRSHRFGELVRSDRSGKLVRSNNLGTINPEGS